MRRLLQIVNAAGSYFLPRHDTLCAHEELLCAIYDSAPIGIAIMDLDGQFVEANAAFQRMTGFAEAELRAVSDESLTYSEDIPRNLALLQELRDGKKECFTLDKRYRTKGGTVIWVRNAVSMLKHCRRESRCLIALSEDITERKRAEHELKEYADQLRALSRRLVEVQEESQRALSRELHDCIGQKLTALNLNLRIALDQLPEPVKAEVGPRLKDSQELVRATVDNIIDVMAELRSPLPDGSGLISGLRAIAEQFARRTGIEVKVRGPEDLDRLDHQVLISLCRIVQEALNNLSKHAQATRVELEVALPPGQLVLTIADNGIGFDPDAPAPLGKRTGWGMLTMRERAQSIGGILAVDSTPGRGTRVKVVLGR